MSPTQSPPVDVPMLRFTQESFSESSRRSAWRETLRQNIVGLEFEELNKDRYRYSSVGIAMPGLGVVNSNATPYTARRTPKLLADGNDNLRLLILRRSTTPAIAAQFGREITIDPGGAVVLSNAEQNSITFPRPLRLLALNLRRQALRPLLRDFDAVIARPIPRQVEALRLLSIYVEGLCDEPRLSSPEVVRLAVVQIYDLAALTMGATRDVAEIAKGRGLRVARLRAIKADVAERLASPDLSVEAVALRQRVSPRYVQILFEQEGITFSQYVIGQRLTRAYRMLTDPRFADRSITSVAFDAGFGDLSYFNRAFRRYYGGTPSEVRAEALRHMARQAVSFQRRFDS
jgi:AraC-like DNA-binding protein